MVSVPGGAARLPRPHERQDPIARSLKTEHAMTASDTPQSLVFVQSHQGRLLRRPNLATIPADRVTSYARDGGDAQVACTSLRISLATGIASMSLFGTLENPPANPSTGA
jgi:hypothetical protein